MDRVRATCRVAPQDGRPAQAMAKERGKWLW